MNDLPFDPQKALPEARPQDPVAEVRPDDLPGAMRRSRLRPNTPAGRAVGAGLLYLLFWQIVTHLPFEGIFVVWFTTLISLLLVLLFTVCTARALRSPRALLISLGISGALILPSILVPILAARFSHWAGWNSVLPNYHAYRAALSRVPGLSGLLLIWFAAGIGVAVSRLVREFKMLLPMAVALACVDIYVVFGGGLVTQAISGKSPVARAAMQALTVTLPTRNPKIGAAPMELSVGFADFLFVALFFACFVRFDIPSRRTFQVLWGVLAAYMLVVFYTGISLPALVPIAIVVIGRNWRRFHYERSEAFALLYAGLIIAAIAVGFYLFLHH